jgi:hypothetical protein
MRAARRCCDVVRCWSGVHNQIDRGSANGSRECAPDDRLRSVKTLHRVRDTATYKPSTPHHSAMNSAVALVDFRKESRSTYSLKPCIAAPLAPKHRLGMLYSSP